MKSTYNVIGVMAGSSMDGLDISHIRFNNDGFKWDFNFVCGETIAYPSDIYAGLKNSSALDKVRLKTIDTHFGEWIGKEIERFIEENNLTINLIAVHGHTVVHEPLNSISWQLGRGDVISKQTGITTITDFRTKDILLGGQGAPLVPMGDFELFSEYDACLNLGGIANISIKSTKTAWDITPCNQLLNFYAKKLDKEYDRNGELSRHGRLDQNFLKKLNEKEFFSKKPPKSLPNQFVEKRILELFDPQDGLRSATEFIAQQIAIDTINMKLDAPKMLVTGGGAHNAFLVERIKHHLSDWDITTPSKQIIDFKEAIVFGFLGALKLENKINVLASVTGAAKDSSSGVIHFAK